MSLRHLLVVAFVFVAGTASAQTAQSSPTPVERCELLARILARPLDLSTARVSPAEAAAGTGFSDAS
jgi:hypothetical protein